MAHHFGQFNPALTQAVNAIANAASDAVYWSPHAFSRGVLREIDHQDAMTCLRKGKVFGPEMYGGQSRANVIHHGIHVRVAIGGLDGVAGDWSALESFVVCSVMKV